MRKWDEIRSIGTLKPLLLSIIAQQLLHSVRNKGIFNKNNYNNKIEWLYCIGALLDSRQSWFMAHGRSDETVLVNAEDSHAVICPDFQQYS